MKKPTATLPGFADMFATVDAAAAVESRFADIEAALIAEAAVLNTAGGEAFQRGHTMEARRLLKAAGASAKLREKIRALQTERAPAATEEAPSPVLSALRPPSTPKEGTTAPAAHLTVPRAALLAAALPVLRTRKARRSGRVSVTFADGHVAFDCGSAAFVAEPPPPARGPASPSCRQRLFSRGCRARLTAATPSTFASRMAIFTFIACAPPATGNRLRVKSTRKKNPDDESGNEPSSYLPA